MNFGDQRFDCKSEFSKRLTSELREIATHGDTFNPQDMGLIFDLQYLMLVFDSLNEQDLIRGTPKVSEAQDWLAKFEVNFKAWESYEDYSGLIGAFKKFVKVCEDHS
jgi:hypothetical protein